MKYFLFIFIPVNIFFGVSAQNFSVTQYRRDLNIKLESIDEKRLEKGVEELNQASIFENEALDILRHMPDSELIEGSSGNYKKMMRSFHEASNTYHEGHLYIYTVYNENCTKFLEEMRKMNHYASGMNKARYYEQKGESNMKRAALLREVLLEADKPEWMQYKMHESMELEKLAIRDKGRALQIYQDFPVEYDYDWADDVSAEELARYYKNPVINLPPDDVFKKSTKEQEKPQKGKIEFRVQIAAHTVILEDDYIRTFYTGEDSVMQIREGKWYKYQIGAFDNFKDADNLRIKCRVPRAFVVAYQDDQKLTIKEALALIQSGQ